MNAKPLRRAAFASLLVLMLMMFKTWFQARIQSRNEVREKTSGLATEVARPLHDKPAKAAEPSAKVSDQVDLDTFRAALDRASAQPIGMHYVANKVPPKQRIYHHPTLGRMIEFTYEDGTRRFAVENVSFDISTGVFTEHQDQKRTAE